MCQDFGIFGLFARLPLVSRVRGVPEAGLLDVHQVAIKVEGFFHNFGDYFAVDAYVAGSTEEGAIDFALAAFFVVAHEPDKCIIVVASKSERTVVFEHEIGYAVYPFRIE